MRSKEAKTLCGGWGSGNFECGITVTSRALKLQRDEMARALTEEMAREFTAIFKSLGFKFVTLDLEGFRSGSMNRLLPAAELTAGRWKS